MDDATRADERPSIERILRERAAALARPPSAEGAVDVLSLVVVAVGSEHYGIDVGHVQEILPTPELVSVPCTPAMWAGLVNLRGTLVPVLNLRARLGLESTPPSDAGAVVVVTDRLHAIALLVDEAQAVARVSRDELDDSLTGPPSGRADLIRGVTPDLLSVLDVEALLGDPSLLVHEDVR